jgi:hypothetical protein
VALRATFGVFGAVRRPHASFSVAPVGLWLWGLPAASPDVTSRAPNLATRHPEGH